MKTGVFFLYAILLSSCMVKKQIFCDENSYGFYFSYEQYEKFGKIRYCSIQRFRDGKKEIFPYTDREDNKHGHLTDTPPDMIFLGKGSIVHGSIDPNLVTWPGRLDGLHKISTIDENITIEVHE